MPDGSFPSGIFVCDRSKVFTRYRNIDNLVKTIEMKRHSVYNNHNAEGVISLILCETAIR